MLHCSHKVHLHFMFIANLSFSLTLYNVLVDRKPDLIFGMKDFIFSHEPSSWRFDVREELKTNGGASYKQVVDFTDDTTGSPHSVARSHVAMYVNEVSMTLMNYYQ